MNTLFCGWLGWLLTIESTKTKRIHNRLIDRVYYERGVLMLLFLFLSRQLFVFIKSGVLFFQNEMTPLSIVLWPELSLWDSLQQSSHDLHPRGGKDKCDWEDFRVSDTRCGWRRKSSQAKYKRRWFLDDSLWFLLACHLPPLCFFTTKEPIVVEPWYKWSRNNTLLFTQ